MLSALPFGVNPRYLTANLSGQNRREMAFIFHVAQRPDNLNGLLWRQSVKHILQLLPCTRPIPKMLVTHLTTFTLLVAYIRRAGFMSRLASSA
jgi:hypothetical protein